MAEKRRSEKKEDLPSLLKEPEGRGRRSAVEEAKRIRVILLRLSGRQTRPRKNGSRSE